MPKLNTIQTKENLHNIYPMGEKGPGGAYHLYEINAGGKYEIPIIQFQEGPRTDPNSTPGIIDSDLLEIVRHRLQCFQEGEFACDENSIALLHIEKALEWMNKRVEDRIARGVLGKNEV